MEKFIDSVWALSLERIAKKGTAGALRSSLGDDIDIYIPQIHTIMLLQANPEIASFIYKSAYTSANRNTYTVMKKLGMPPDYFWKFEYWPKERAYDTLKRVINRVFTAMMNLNKEGSLDLTNVDVEKLRLTIAFKDCAECAGVAAAKGICYYHAATFAGIIGALIGKDMDAFETECHAPNGAACVFLIGKRDDPEMAAGLGEYLVPPEFTGVDKRLADCLSGNSLRSQGNLVNIGYYQLMLTNILASNPEMLAAASFEAGVEHGKRMAPVIAEFFGANDLDVIGKYYCRLHHLTVRGVAVGDGVDITLSEIAEVAAALRKQELLEFLFGELQGLVSSLLESNMVYRESHLDGNDLAVRLSPQE